MAALKLIDDFLIKLKSLNSISAISLNIGILISDLLRIDAITLYEGYVLNTEYLKYRRKFYLEPMQNRSVRISDLLRILNQIHLALAFEEINCVELFNCWLIEAKELNEENRQHEIASNLDYFNGVNREGLQRLLEIRELYDKLSDNDGPFPIEQFPYHFYRPEALLLQTDTLTLEKTLSEPP